MTKQSLAAQYIGYIALHPSEYFRCGTHGTVGFASLKTCSYSNFQC